MIGYRPQGMKKSGQQYRIHILISAGNAIGNQLEPDLLRPFGIIHGKF
jgi:hypothetical protein